MKKFFLDILKDARGNVVSSRLLALFAAAQWIPAITFGFFYTLYFRAEYLIEYFEVLAVMLLSLSGISVWLLKNRKKNND